jgi:hypothetical protein
VIIDVIVTAFLAALDALFSLLPSFNLPQPDDIPYVFGAILDMDRLFPVRTVMGIFGASIVVILAMRLWDAIVWTYHQFWGAS